MAMDIEELGRDAEVMELYQKFHDEYCNRIGTRKGDDGKPLPCGCPESSLLFSQCQPALCFCKWALEHDKARTVGKMVMALKRNSEGKKSSDSTLQVRTEFGIMRSIFSGMPEGVKSVVAGAVADAKESGIFTEARKRMEEQTGEKRNG